MKRCEPAILLMVVTLSACSSGNDSTRVTSAQFEERWPFTVPSGTIHCDRESLRSARVFVTLDAGNGIHYALNGSARTFGYPDHRDILKPDRTGADVQPFIDMGLKLCHQE